MNGSYTSLAACYDRLNAHVDYEGYAGYLAEQMKKAGVPDGALVLDLACGTGNITLPLARRGFDMIGADLSQEMLNEARKKTGADRVLWLLQDMRSFELFGTVGAVVCCLDSINYLTGRVGLHRCFSLVHNYLDPDGVFLFDVNSLYKFTHVYGDNHYILEADGVYCGWKNHYDPEAGLCDFELSVFRKEGDSYRRYDECQRERYWSHKTLTAQLSACGFELIGTYGDFSGDPPGERTERLYYAARAKK